MTLAAGNTLPCEYANMEWRVDLYRSSVVDAARLQSITTFCAGVDSPQRGFFY